MPPPTIMARLIVFAIDILLFPDEIVGKNPYQSLDERKEPIVEALKTFFQSC